jgi:GTP-binding protein Era
VFIDTPGRKKKKKKFNKKLTEISGRALDDSDIVLYVLDACRPPGQEEEEIAALLVHHAQRTVVAFNKIDCNGADCIRAKEFIAHNIPGLGEGRCFPVSAKNNEGIEALLAALYDMAGEGEPFYDAEYYTDQEVDFRISEIIREQAINRLRQELPHALYVEVADAWFIGPEGEQNNGKKLNVRAFIIVERESQKGMVVGKGGAMIREIRLASLKELREIFDWKIDLDIRVKTGKDWRHNDRTLRKITT